MAIEIGLPLHIAIIVVIIIIIIKSEVHHQDGSELSGQYVGKYSSSFIHYEICT